MSTEQSQAEAITTLIDGHTGPTTEVPEPVTVPQQAPVDASPVGAAARVLEAATVVGDQLVADAQAEADALLATAREEAEALRAATHAEVDVVTDALARHREEQVTELDRERHDALSALTEEKAALKQEIASLQQLESDYRARLRRHLSDQLAQLDAIAPAPPVAAAS